MAFRKHLPVGTRVKLVASMGVREGRANYCHGVITRRDGEYYNVNVDYHGRDEKYRKTGVDCDRYLSEIESAFIEGKWTNGN